MRLLEMLFLSLLQLSNICLAGLCSWLGCCVLSRSEALRQAVVNSRAVFASGACASAVHHSCLLCHANHFVSVQCQPSLATSRLLECKVHAMRVARKCKSRVALLPQLFCTPCYFLGRVLSPCAFG